MHKLALAQGICLSALACLHAARALAVTPTPVLQPFSYADVHVTGGPMAAQAEGARDFYLNLNEDSLLQGFRLRAGLAAPGQPMGGWYDPDNFAGAHPFGQYVSALSRIYANTRDARYKQKVARLVHGFYATFAADGYFYASAKVAKEWPCYVYDKNAAGMRDAYLLTGNAEALTVLRRMTDWADANLPRRSDEWYTLAEGFYLDYALTHEARYLRLAAEYDYSAGFFDAFAAGTNAFTPDRHAYSHVNSLVSAARTYEATGNAKYLAAIQSAWTFLTETQMYASGGWGPDERFVTPGQGKLAASLETTTHGFETPCGTYANMNLNRYLLRFTGDPKYGDHMERVLLNGMLSALPNQSRGDTFYYSSYHPGTQKVYYDKLWPCCSGTYAQITADYPLDLYFHDAHGIYVNLFASSQVRWQVAGERVALVQRTDYPLGEGTRLTIHARHPRRFFLHVRVPRWLGASKAAFRLNGRPIEVAAPAGRFAAIEREWREGDVLEVDLPKSLRFESIDPQTPERAALMFGPLVLPALADGDLSLAGDAAHPERWIKPAQAGLSDFTAADGTLFRPLYLIQNERYTTYPRVLPVARNGKLDTSF